MRILILIVSLFIGYCNAFAAQTGSATADTAAVGTVSTIGNPTSQITLSAGNGQGFFGLYTNGVAITAGNYAPFYKNGVAYQVSSGKSFQVYQICVESPGTSAAFSLVSATASFAHNASSITGGVYQSGTVSNYNMFTSASAEQVKCWNWMYSFAQNTYPGIQGNTATGYRTYLVGREI